MCGRNAKAFVVCAIITVLAGTAGAAPVRDVAVGHLDCAVCTIERVRAAVKAFENGCVRYAQTDAVLVAAQSSPLTAREKEGVEDFTARESPGGALVLSDRIEGELQQDSFGAIYTRLKRIGGNGFESLSFSDGEASFSFLTRNPEHIVRRAIKPSDVIGLSIVATRANELTSVIAKKHARVLRQEIFDGVLCDVIGLAWHSSSRRPAHQIREFYYVGKLDGLIRRYVSEDKSEGRDRYREETYSFDLESAPGRITLQRLESEAANLANGKVPAMVDESR
jgi:hypothetical protein